MKTSLNKLRVESLVIEHDVKLFVKVGFVKVMEKSWTMWDTTGPDHSIKYRLGLLVGQQIAADNHLEVSQLVNLLIKP